ncbi:DNA-binding transcriptional regulator YbjK [Microbacterium resistens]|uniref:DNA-binding transcriptional regulator YbjK n=1 Tax=Microbacterium resistens TaxID=156977 RepID=A0ABU1SA88_9MICO|nr:TetR family transcriptional regulator [Microbacterium resistens]MDR6866509.1 DNA-binding transcriptional regulator YbjK [Microbacterium resistens]
MGEQTRGRRDPEARRRAMVTAAAELISEVGVDAVTHRMVAARAAVPLGSTTQYFATLDDLRAAGLQHLAADIDARIDGLHEVLTARGVSAATLAALISQGLTDAQAVKADRAVVTAAVNDPRLQELARHWWERMASFLEPTCGRERAALAAIFTDGVLWHSLAGRVPVDRSLIESGFAAILGEPSPSFSDRPATS